MSGNRKHPPGFAPIDFHLAGKVVLIIGVILTFFAAANYIFEWIANYSYITILALLLVLAGIYLNFVVPKEKM